MTRQKEVQSEKRNPFQGAHTIRTWTKRPKGPFVTEKGATRELLQGFGGVPKDQSYWATLYMPAYLASKAVGSAVIRTATVLGDAIGTRVEDV